MTQPIKAEQFYKRLTYWLLFILSNILSLLVGYRAGEYYQAQGDYLLWQNYLKKQLEILKPFLAEPRLGKMGGMDLEAQGYRPSVYIEPVSNTSQSVSKQELYEELWKNAEYRQYSPAMTALYDFLRITQPKKGESVIDFGCGTGRAGAVLAAHGLEVTLIDIASNCLDEDVMHIIHSKQMPIRFKQLDITQPFSIYAHYGFCIDVLEHIEPSSVPTTIENLLRACQHLFLQIATRPDQCGQLVNQKLHLSVHDYKQWREIIQSQGAEIIWSRKIVGGAQFYVSAWSTGADVVKACSLNVSEDVVRHNVEQNIQAGWKQVSPHLPCQDEVMIVGGGPSLNKSEPEIRRRREKGAKLVTLNGAYNWCIERSLTPSATIIVDARPHNARFVKPVVEKCQYLLASQVDPSVFEGLPKERTWLWHTTSEMIKDILMKYYGDEWWGIPGGSTVLLRAIPLLRMLGYSRFHLFGCDSCLKNGAHHAYVQPENNTEFIIPVTIGKRVFFCHPWMVSQAQEFMDLIRFMGDTFSIKVHGDGLLAYIIQTAAELSSTQEEQNASRNLEGLCKS